MEAYSAGLAMGGGGVQPKSSACINEILCACLLHWQPSSQWAVVREWGIPAIGCTIQQHVLLSRIVHLKYR